MAKKDSSIDAPDPKVGQVVDAENVIAQILQVRVVNGVDSPLAGFNADRVYCPFPGTKPGGEEDHSFRNDDPSTTFRIEEGSRSTANFVTTVDVTFFSLGGRPNKAAMAASFAAAKQNYRALVHRLGLVDNEKVAGGTMMGATELSVGKAEQDPGVGKFPAYRSKWRIKLRANA